MTTSNDNAHQRRILILGGTGEARELAAALIADGHAVISSLAGRTQAPTLPPGEIRVGGFGGPQGLAAYLDEQAIDLLVDATHPFAARMSANAATAASSADVPLIRLERPAWSRPQGAIWLEVPDMRAAADTLPEGARVLLTVGRQDLDPFRKRADCTFFARMIEIPPDLPPAWTIIAHRGPFTLAQEKAVLTANAVTHLVSKNSGAPQVAAKLAAAAQLNVPVIMIARPALPEAETVQTVAQAREAIGRLFRTG